MRPSAWLLVTSLAMACSATTSPATDAAPADAGTDAASSCPSDLPSACATPPPSYAADIEPLVHLRCFPCHAAGGVAATKHDFSSYAGLYAQRRAVLTQVYSCQMPPANGTVPSAPERAALLGWLVCGAPNN